MKPQDYKAAWAYVTIKVIDPATGVSTVMGLNEGGHVPPSADPEDVKRLVAKGALKPVDMTEPPSKAEAKPEPKFEAKPATEPSSEKADDKTAPAKAPAKATEKAADKAQAKSGNGS